MNVNQDFFRRFSADNKVKMAENLSDADINRMNYDTLSRIIKEACTEANYRTVYFPDEQRVSNNWNANLAFVCCSKRKEPAVYFDIFYSNTDGTAFVPLKDLFSRGELRFSHEYNDYCGGRQTAYYRFSESKVMEIKKNIVIACIKAKYADKLKKAVAA